MVHSDQVENVEVFAGLGHDALVGSDDQQRSVDATHPSQHVLDEPFVTGNVDNADFPTVGQTQPGETQVDRHAARLLFAEAVRVDPGQCLNERRFPVVNVTGSPNRKHAIPCDFGGPAVVMNPYPTRVDVIREYRVTRANWSPDDNPSVGIPRSARCATPANNPCCHRIRLPLTR